MTITTKTGDRGETGMIGGGRISKADSRMHAVGTVDELCALLGAIQAKDAIGTTLRDRLTMLQHRLFRLGADLASPADMQGIPRIEEAHVRELEEHIADLEASLPAQTSFILPGGSGTGSLLHLARTVCRRAERWTVALASESGVNPQVLVFLNRLGDDLFLMAREANRDDGRTETEVKY